VLFTKIFINSIIRSDLNFLFCSETLKLFDMMKPFLSGIALATARKKVKIRANKINLQPEEKV
jgi:hypothetical protein